MTGRHAKLHVIDGFTGQTFFFNHPFVKLIAFLVVPFRREIVVHLRFAPGHQVRKLGHAVQVQEEGREGIEQLVQPQVDKNDFTVPDKRKFHSLLFGRSKVRF